ncbi:MAG: NfeD family protein [Desulfurococcaceae archaeon]
MRKASLFAALILLLGLVAFSTHTENGTGELERKRAVLAVLEMTIDGGAVSFIESTVSRYSDATIVLQINSYGGYLAAADKIISILESNNVSCIAWVPRGGYAVSAAALVALACRRIYMAPGSVIGGVKPSPEDPKVVEYVKARIVSLLEKQNKRNLAWIAEELVEKSRVYSSLEASELDLAIIVDDLSELLEREGLVMVQRVEPSLWDRILSLASNPLVSSLLMLAGVVLVLAEVFTTGFQGYGVAGALMLVFGLYGAMLVPVEVLHLALVLSGAVLLAVEILTPGFGVFGLSGIILTATGFALILTWMPREALTGLVIVVTGGLVALTGLFLFVAVKAAKVARMKRVEMKDKLVGSVGYAKTDIGETTPGVAYVLNEEWTAFSVKGEIKAGSKILVVRVEGLKLYVKEYEE